MRFIRKNGRIIPIRDDDQEARGERGGKPAWGALAEAGAGAALAFGGGLAGQKMRKRFGLGSQIGVTLGSAFAGEALMGDGSDAFIESIHPKHEQAIKNVVSGLTGVVDAAASLYPLLKRARMR